MIKISVIPAATASSTIYWIAGLSTIGSISFGQAFEAGSIRVPRPTAGITAFFTPGFSINSFWTLALAAVVLTAIDYLITKFTGLHASSFGKGFVGFVLAAVVLYVTQYFVAGYTISWMAAIVGALVYGVVDYFLPGEA